MHSFLTTVYAKIQNKSTFVADTDIDTRLWQVLGDKIKKVSFIDVLLCS